MESKVSLTKLYSVYFQEATLCHITEIIMIKYQVLSANVFELFVFC